MGPVRHEVRHVSNLFGRQATGNHRKLSGNCRNRTARMPGNRGRRLWYGPRPCPGQATGRPRRLLWVAVACALRSRARPRWAPLRAAAGRRSGRRTRARGEVALGRARSLLARRAARDAQARLAGSRPGTSRRSMTERARHSARASSGAPRRPSFRRCESPRALRFLYDHGTTSSLEVFFGASRSRTRWPQLDDFSRVASVNDDVLQELQSARTRMTQLDAEARSPAAALDAATRQAAAAAADARADPR